MQIKMNFRCQISILKLSILYLKLYFYFLDTLDKVQLDFSTQLSIFKQNIIYNIKFLLKNL